MPRVPSYRYTTQGYEDSDFSETDQSNYFQRPSLIPTQPIPRPIGRPMPTLANLQTRPVPRRNRPVNNLSYGQMPVASRIQSDVKEIYRRKSLNKSMKDEYPHEDYDSVDQCFYKSPHPYPQQSKKSFCSTASNLVTHPQQSHASPKENSTITQDTFENEPFQSVNYKSIPHVPCSRNSLTRISSGTGLNAVKANPKRFTTNVKTPRFSKKTSSATACKLPSNNYTQTINQNNALRKDCEDENKDEQLSPLTKKLERHHSFPVHKGENISRPLTAPLRDNASVRSNRIESVLKRYEEMVHGMGSNHKLKSFEAISINNNGRANLLSNPNKPQVVNREGEKYQQQENNSEQVQVNENQSPPVIRSPVSSPQKKDSAPSVLQTMLQELMQKGCINKIPENSLKTEIKTSLPITKKLQEEANKRFSSGIIGDSISVDDSKMPKSINYQEMQDSIKKTSVVFQMGEPVTNSTNKEIQVPSSPRLRVNPQSIVAQQSNPLSHNTKLNSNENYSMELHRSKSYIVNLIDRALSKELGTVPDDRVNCYCLSSKGQCNNDQNGVVGMIGKHTKKTEPKELSLDLTNAFSDSRTSNEVAHHLEIKEDCMCPCSSSHGEEPTYIKQLKQLRWGHLKHIQREVRRLTDLERFLDSCNNYE